MVVQSSMVEQAAAALLRGEAVIFPTDTVYGVGVAVGAAKEPQLLYNLKERESGKPIAWLVGGVEDLDRYGRAVPELAYRLAQAFWPGPLTLVVKASGQVPPAFCSEAGTIGLRMPDNKTARALIRAVGTPIATTSANFSGQTASCRSDRVDPDFVKRVGVMVADVDDAGKSGIASTVVDCTQTQPAIVREGAVTVADIQLLS